MPLGEKKLIEQIRRRARGGPSLVGGLAGGLVTGIGDDCAVLRVPAGHELLSRPTSPSRTCTFAGIGTGLSWSDGIA